jgi:hypothetical protein
MSERDADNKVVPSKNEDVPLHNYFGGNHDIYVGPEWHKEQQARSNVGRIALLAKEADAQLSRLSDSELLKLIEAMERKIELAPGFALRDFLGHFCQKKFRERVLEALHAEAIADYQEAIANGNEIRAKSIRRMINVWLVMAMFGGMLAWVAGKLSFKVGASGE